MTRLTTHLGAVGLALMLVVPVAAQQEATPWQDTITGQIEAMRIGDAATALGYAGAAFQVAFPDPAAFLVVVAQSGYEPILTSASHSFGPFQKLDAKSVMQQVHLVGKDQRLYEVFYQLMEEPGGWRVEGVQLTNSNAIGV